MVQNANATQNSANQYSQPSQQVGRLMNVDEHEKAMGQRHLVDNTISGNDPNQVQSQIQDHISTTNPGGYIPQQK